MISGLDPLRLVLTAAYTRPDASVLRLRWSSATPLPDTAVSGAAQVVSAWPSVWMTNWSASGLPFWLLYMTPSLFPPNAMSVEMSSLPTVAEPGRMNGVPHVSSLPVVRFTQIRPPCSQVAHSLPVESLSITSVSDRTLLIVAGNPVSSEYVSVEVL